MQTENFQEKGAGSELTAVGIVRVRPPPCNDISQLSILRDSTNIRDVGRGDDRHAIQQQQQKPSGEVKSLKVVWQDGGFTNQPQSMEPVPERLWKNGKAKLEPLKIKSSMVCPLKESEVLPVLPINEVKWLRHRFAKIRASQQQYRMVSDPDQTIVCKAVSGRCRLFGEEFAVKVSSGVEAEATLIKSCFGCWWELYIDERLDMTIKYDSDVIAESCVRVRKLELCTYQPNTNIKERFVSKLPEWNAEKKCHSLSFDGRVGHVSVHNCVLTRQDFYEPVLMFGVAHSAQNFILDFRPPLTKVQAFALAISSLAFKLGSM